MKHLSEGLIKQRGVVKINPYMEISNPTFNDICQEGNIAVVHDYSNIFIYVVLPEFDNVKPNNGPFIVRWNSLTNKYSLWKTSDFEQDFPNNERYDIHILKVFKTNINPKNIKTVEDLKDITLDFKKHVKI